MLSRKDNGISKQLAVLPYKAEGKHLHLAVPKSALGVSGDDFVLDFQWADNVSLTGPIEDRYLRGDVAPEGRFRYRYGGRGER